MRTSEKTNMVGSLFTARKELDGKYDIVISYTDIVYPTKVVTTLVESSAQFGVIVDKGWRTQWEARMENPLEDAETMKIDGQGQIIELGKKPRSFDDIQGQYIGLVKISRDSVLKIVEFYDGLDKFAKYDGKDFDNMYMTSFIQLLIDNKVVPVFAVYINGGWTEIDTPSDLNYKIDLTHFD